MFDWHKLKDTNTVQATGTNFLAVLLENCQNTELWASPVLPRYQSLVKQTLCIKFWAFYLYTQWNLVHCAQNLANIDAFWAQISVPHCKKYFQQHCKKIMEPIPQLNKHTHTAIGEAQTTKIIMFYVTYIQNC